MVKVPVIPSMEAQNHTKEECFLGDQGVIPSSGGPGAIDERHAAFMLKSNARRPYSQ